MRTSILLFLLVFVSNHGYSQKLCLSISTTGFRTIKTEVSNDQLNHFLKSQYKNDLVVKDIIRRNYTNKGSASAIIGTPILTGFVGTYYPKIINGKKNPGLGIVLGANTFRQTEEFSSIYVNNEDNNQSVEILYADLDIVRTSIVFGMNHIKEFYRKKKLSFGFIMEATFNVNISPRARLNIDYNVDNQNKLKISNHLLTVARQNFLHSNFGLYGEYRLSRKVSTKFSAGYNALLFGSGEYGKKIVTAPNINCSLAFKI